MMTAREEEKDDLRQYGKRSDEMGWDTEQSTDVAAARQRKMI